LINKQRGAVWEQGPERFGFGKVDLVARGGGWSGATGFESPVTPLFVVTEANLVCSIRALKGYVPNQSTLVKQVRCECAEEAYPKLLKMYREKLSLSGSGSGSGSDAGRHQTNSTYIISAGSECP
jgi:hypothetical protein